MNKKAKITQEEISRALRKFRHQGGIVRQLPEEVRIHSTTIGERHGAFESWETTASGAIIKSTNESTF